MKDLFESLKPEFPPKVEITTQERDNIIERLQFYQNKIERLEHEKKELLYLLDRCYHVLENKTPNQITLLKDIEDFRNKINE